MRHSGFVLRNNIALMVTAVLPSFKTVDKLQRKRLHQSRAIGFSWNGQTQVIPVNKAFHLSFVIVHTQYGQWQASSHGRSRHVLQS